MILHHPSDTIAAIATPPGEGGIAVIRISGPSAMDFAEQMFSRSLRKVKSHTAVYGDVLDAQSDTIDDGLALVFRGKKSYTGEDTVEFQCHGGSLISRAVLSRAIELGCRPAEPGEFTKRAFLNGKLDLVQAESVQEIIHAKNTLAIHASKSHLEGKLSKRIEDFQKRLVDLSAILEAWVDFPEEGLEFTTFEEFTDQLAALVEQMRHLESTFHEGKRIHEGLKICLIGRPNVGKSSLMNALLEKPRAIVTHIAGTTRDLIEDHLILDGMNIQLTDTAGLREAEEIVEAEGIKRSEEAMENSDLVLLVVDRSTGLCAEDLKILNQVPHSKTILVWNKCDLEDNSQKISLNSVEVSAKQAIGLEKLREAISTMIWKEGPPSKEEVIISNLRQKNALAQAVQHCLSVIEGIKSGVSPEFLTFDLRSALHQLGTVIGQNITEEILSSIFSRFCIGK